MNKNHKSLKDERDAGLSGILAAGASQILLHVKWPIVLETQLAKEGLKNPENSREIRNVR